VKNNVEVDGFTNQVDVSTYPYPSGWELSSARASSVVRYFEAHGLDDRQLSAVGFSDQKPLVPPSDPRSITRNRRVEIVVLSSLPSLAGDALAAAATARDTGNTGATDRATAAASKKTATQQADGADVNKTAATEKSSGAAGSDTQAAQGQAARAHQSAVGAPTAPVEPK
jgi:chemotaxis protein MotB